MTAAIARLGVPIRNEMVREIHLGVKAQPMLRRRRTSERGEHPGVSAAVVHVVPRASGHQNLLFLAV